MLRPGDRFDRYVIEAAIGQGGMGRVYRAEDTKLHRRVALKVLTADKDGDPGRWQEAAARMLREARSAAALDHPCAVSIFDVGEVDGTPYIAMELVPGKNLRYLVGAADVPWERKLRWLLDVGAALAAAHDAGLVHRDVKPENVVLRDDGRVKVLDFGIARRSSIPTEATGPRGSGETVTAQGIVVGTLQYMAPEQLAGKPFDGRADQFAWAVTAYELFAGHVPWPPADDALATAAAVLTQPPPPLGPLAPYLPEPVAAAIHRALAKAPDERFASMGEILKALEPYAAAPSSPSLSTPPPRGVASSPAGSLVDPHAATAAQGGGAGGAAADRGRIRRRRWAAGGALVALIAVGVAWLARDRPQPVTGAPPAASSSALPASEPARPSEVLVLGVENRTSDPVLEGTLETVLGHALQRSNRLAATFGPQLRTLASELGQAPDDRLGEALLARDGGNVFTVRGAVAPKGAGYVLSFEVKDARTGAKVTTQTKDAPDASRVVPAVGELASEIRVALGDGPPDPSAAEQTGMSPVLEADSEFTVAVGLGLSGKNDEAIDHVGRAIALDPEFGYAYAVRGTLLRNMQRESEAAADYKLAIKAAGGMGEYYSLRVQGDYFSMTGEYDQATAKYQDILARWPRDTVTETNACLAYLSSGDVERTLIACRQAAADHPRTLSSRINELTALLVAEDFEQSRRRAQQAMQDLPHPDWRAYLDLGLADVLLGRGSDAVDAYDQLSAADPSVAAGARADFAMYEGRLADASDLLAKGIEADSTAKLADAAARKNAMLAQLRLRKGDTAGAVAAADRAAASAVPATEYCVAQVYLEAHQPKKAQALASRLDQSLSANARRYAKLLEAETLRISGKPREAVDVYRDVLHKTDNWLSHFLLGRTYLDLGAWAEARNELQTCLAHRGQGSMVFLDSSPSLRYVSLATHALARAEDGLGSDDAVAAYKAFLAHEPAPQGDPLADDARRRLDGR
jgi:tetratricopeptide (TPR) repeat protein